MTIAAWSLTVGIALLVLVLGRAQLKGKLDLADGFKDEAGRTSAGRMCAVGAWLASTWYLMDHDVPDMVYLGYVVVWALLMMGSKGLDVLQSILAKR